MMHTLIIILTVLLALLVIFLGIVAFVAISAFFAVQPILNQLGKISMIIEALEFIKRRVKRALLRRQFSASGRSSNHHRGQGYHRDRDGYNQNKNTSQGKDKAIQTKTAISRPRDHGGE